MPLEIRDANFDDPADCAAVLAVLDAYASEPIGGGQPLSREVSERLLPELRQQTHALVLLAFVASQPVGVAVCFFGFSTFNARPLLNVHDLAVLPESRGQGVGRALLVAAEGRALERGCCKLTLEVREDNERARGLYRSVGFGNSEFGSAIVPTLFLNKSLT